MGVPGAPRSGVRRQATIRPRDQVSEINFENLLFGRRRECRAQGGGGGGVTIAQISAIPHTHLLINTWRGREGGGGGDAGLCKNITLYRINLTEAQTLPPSSSPLPVCFPPS